MAMGNVCLYSHLVSSGAAYLYWPGSVNFPWGQPRGYILEGDNKFLPQSQFTLRETFSLKKTLKKSTTVKMQSNHLFAYTGKNKWYEKKCTSRSSWLNRMKNEFILVQNILKSMYNLLTICLLRTFWKSLVHIIFNNAMRFPYIMGEYTRTRIDVYRAGILYS